MVFVIHHCKNPACNSAWSDKDLTKCKAPAKWKYCRDCTAKGKKNPAVPPKNPAKVAAGKKRLEG